MLKEIIDLFEAFCKANNCPEWLTNDIVFYLTAISFFLFIFSLLWSGAKNLLRWRNERILNNDLHPYYSKADVYRATRYYIPTHYQNVAPSQDDEPSRKYIAAAKNRLIPLFIKKAFNNDQDDNKFYLILADSGMGKTTFLINLFIRYKNRWRNPLNPNQYEIRLLPLGLPNILDDIENIENKENTILLLDALDEDIEAVKNYKSRLNIILSKVYRFREIVITCRTQFFPSEEEEPTRTGYFSAGENGEYRFQKLYLSVFDEKDIKRYLRKRFSPFQRKKFKRALEIAKKSPNLIVRPMILSKIEELVESNRRYEFSFEIYEEFIERWIKRESKKPEISKKYGSEAEFRQLLYEFSQEFAINLYKNKDRRGGYFIEKGGSFSHKNFNLFDLENDSKLSNKKELSENEKRSKSLLNRNAAGEYKFSHKSVFEYFIALELINNHEFCKGFNPNGMDAAWRFFEEMVIFRLQKSEGVFYFNNNLEKLINLRYQNIKKVSSLMIVDEPSIPIIGIRVFENLDYLRYGNGLLSVLIFMYTASFLSPDKIKLLILSFFRSEKKNTSLNGYLKKQLELRYKLLQSRIDNQSRAGTFSQFSNLLIQSILPEEEKQFLAQDLDLLITTIKSKQISVELIKRLDELHLSALKNTLENSRLLNLSFETSPDNPEGTNLFPTGFLLFYKNTWIDFENTYSDNNLIYLNKMLQQREDLKLFLNPNCEVEDIIFSSEFWS